MTTPPPEPTVSYSGCPWPIDTACLGTEWAQYGPAVRDRAVALASESLHRLTANRVGGCPITVRPCAPWVRPARGGLFGSASWITPTVYGGRWMNSCGHANCSCLVVNELRLPAPVGEVVEVWLDGEVLPAGRWRLEDGNALVPTDGSPWPAVQDLSLPLTEPGTFGVTYLNAYPVDQLGAQAAAYLALEFAKACSGKGGKCKLPRGVTAIARQGVQFEVQTGLFPDGLTGIDVVDAFILLWKPEGSPSQQSRVYVPGSSRMRRA